MLIVLLAATLLAWPCCAFSEQNDPKVVLLLHSFRSAMPINARYAAGILEGLNRGGDLRLEIDSEALDLGRVNDEDYVRKLIAVFRAKYRGNPPNVIVATYTPALRFLLGHGHEIFPGVPVVFCGAELSFIDRTLLPPNITGVASTRDFRGTLELMARLHPDMRRVAVVVGSGYLDQQWEEDARQAFRPYEGRFEFLWLRGLPFRDLVESVRTLPKGTPVLFVIQFADRNGVPNVPIQVVRALSDAANAPVYGLFDGLVGAGALGGRVIRVNQDALAAGEIARRIVMGEAASAIPVVRLSHNDAVFDARQLKRWNVDERLLPQDADVRFREPTFVDEYWQAIVLFLVVIIIEATLIVALLISRRRLQGAQATLGREYDQRVQAESATRRIRARLGVAEKQSTVGALTSGIAHEINQPLTAIKSYVRAASRYVTVESPEGRKVSDLLVEVEGEADRAAAIIQKVRKLIAAGRVDAVTVQLEPVLKQVIAAMSPELDAHDCRVHYDSSAGLPAVLADPVQIQLVMVNLMRNAMEAMESSVQSSGRSVDITQQLTNDHHVEISVADCGAGVPPDMSEEIFDPLFSTKVTGMGVGLATCRTIVQAHGGRIWHEPNPQGGTIFRFTLPIAAARR